LGSALRSDPSRPITRLRPCDSENLPVLSDPPTVEDMDKATHQETVATGEKLSREEIWRRYPDEWVVLVDTDRSNMTTTADVVYGHSPCREEARAISRGLRSCAVFRTGKIRSPSYPFRWNVHRAV
jgi:hypothetical protein